MLYERVFPLRKIMRVSNHFIHTITNDDYIQKQIYTDQHHRNADRFFETAQKNRPQYRDQHQRYSYLMF